MKAADLKSHPGDVGEPAAEGSEPLSHRLSSFSLGSAAQLSPARCRATQPRLPRERSAVGQQILTPVSGPMCGETGSFGRLLVCVCVCVRWWYILQTDADV